jgi:hypothetical protein
LESFPTPAGLWARYRSWKGFTAAAEAVVLQDYFEDPTGKEPRYYQCNAINTTIEAIVSGINRILLVMATGTGKTYTAFQIIWRLWKAGRKKRILYLADRNILVDQTMVNDFRPFGPVMAKLSTGAKTIERADGTEVSIVTALDKQRRIDTAFEVYLGLYQAITGPEDRQKLFREFSPDFFDLTTRAVCVSEQVASRVGPEVSIPQGALLIAMSGATTGKVAFNKTGRRLLLNQRVGRLEPFLLGTDYVRFFFETIVVRNLSISFGTAIPNLSTEQINNTVLPLPPLAEQHRIVAKVDQLMALCDRLKAQLTTTQTQSRRLLESTLHHLLAA